ncbi:hypothetical protein QFC21_004670 [Naganishia friedmannii]|uniref:Uncharacterized protein n=1 Tax=Naganishia friedmannii TaxID=89922 RepID=A0ACC2VF87_9TREE|nr:hypothetical protein QFC21_004670 [Naganishia friedmannii]
MPLVKPEGGWKGWKKKLEAELVHRDAQLSSADSSSKQWWASYVSSSISHVKIRQNRKASKVTVGFGLPHLVIKLHLAKVHWDDQKKRSDPTFWSVKCFTISSFKEVQHKTFEDCFLHREGRKRTKGFADFVATLGLKDTETDDLLKKIKAASLQNYEQCKQEQREYENAILEQTHHAPKNNESEAEM